MSKRSAEGIIAAIRRCISGESSQTAEAKLLGVPVQTLQDWIRKYETFGTDGFLPRVKEKYGGLLGHPEVRDVLSQSF